MIFQNIHRRLTSILTWSRQFQITEGMRGGGEGRERQILDDTNQVGDQSHRSYYQALRRHSHYRYHELVVITRPIPLMARGEKSEKWRGSTVRLIKSQETVASATRGKSRMVCVSVNLCLNVRESCSWLSKAQIGANRIKHNVDANTILFIPFLGRGYAGDQIE